MTGDVTEPAGPDVLADLLELASERGTEKLLEVDAELRELCGDAVVNRAHGVWTDRMRLLVNRGFIPT